jgi:hypothetical protein
MQARKAAGGPKSLRHLVLGEEKAFFAGRNGREEELDGMTAVDDGRFRLTDEFEV